ncbi:putative vesicle-mediated transport protein Vid24 [Pyronema omphalodes]|nr:putative vesicle-mediated transport protein Vid24 [Pyronema omphalodes]
MPTPNVTAIVEIVTTASSENARPSRLHVACPEEPTTTALIWSDAEITESSTSAASSPACEDTASPRPEEGSFASRPACRGVNSFSNKPKSRDVKASTRKPEVTATSHNIPSFGDDTYSTRRIIPSYSSTFLRPGSKFTGRQLSDRSTYEVHVELKHVDMAESFLCGYLRIKGLTEDHPTLITYFEGEMIGPKHDFITKKPEWGSNERNDEAHWKRFAPFRSFKDKHEQFDYKNFAQKDHIFMRWKEYFLVPDHKVRQISGASFEGFYYICFNQVTGVIDGIYFHAKTEKFQKLQLKYVPERTFAAIEFR